MRTPSKRKVREENPRFLVTKATLKPMPSLARRKALKKAQRKARQIRRTHA